MKVLTVQPFDQIGSPMEIVSLFGGKQKYLQVITELENELYKVA
jgi:type I restriction enzyme R subunit